MIPMNHIPRNVAIPMFGFIRNLLRFLGMWDDNVWFIHRNLKWIIYFFHSILIFECELPSPFKKIFLLINNEKKYKLLISPLKKYIPLNK